MSEQIAPGLYYGMSNAEYHSQIGISKSGLDLIAKSPAHYYAKYLDPNRPPGKDQTAAQLDGELAHCAILEPDEFSKRFIVGPDVSRTTKAWKEFAEANAGKTTIKPDQYVTAWRQSDSVNGIPDLARALSRGMPEVSAFWIDAETGVLCKCRPDWVNDLGAAGDLLIDAKTCGDASLRDFCRMIAKHRYHVQDAWYRDGYALASGRPVNGFVFAAVEMDYPHAASAIMLDDDSVEQGRREYRRLLDIYAECKQSGKWPGHSTEVQLARLPGWAFDQEEELEISFI